KMVEPSKRSRSVKKTKKRTPGGRTATHYRRDRHNMKPCARCGKKLQGVNTGSSATIRNLTQSQRKPAKPYAGVLCNQCTDELVRYVTRFEAKYKKKLDLDLGRDLTLEKYLPRGWHDRLANQ
ncbi:MAG: hypothetical protein GF334_05240, partial [Candidatus Altiarchaeales archaeon]|nr:hypothetical protein [Candidatus Altiarchaeales archaeon]